MVLESYKSHGRHVPELAARLRQLRRHRRPRVPFTLLAASAGVTRQCLRDIERRQRTSARTLTRLRKLLERIDRGELRFVRHGRQWQMEHVENPDTRGHCALGNEICAGCKIERNTPCPRKWLECLQCSYTSI